MDEIWTNFKLQNEFLTDNRAFPAQFINNATTISLSAIIIINSLDT